MGFFKNLFGKKDTGTTEERHETISKDEALGAYIIREHKSGRSVTEILDDPYLKNRTTDEQRLRLLERPEVIRAIGENTAADARESRSRARARPALARTVVDELADREVLRCDPEALEEDDVLVALPAGQLARRRPLTARAPRASRGRRARRARRGRPPRSSPARASRSTRTTRARGRGCRARARYAVRADRADERAGLQPLAPQHRIARVGDRDDDVLLRRVAVPLRLLGAEALAKPAPVLVAAVGDHALDPGSAARMRLDLALGLPAAADHAERLRVGAREVLRGDRARRSGAPLAEPVGLDDREQLRAVGGDRAGR